MQPLLPDSGQEQCVKVPCNRRQLHKKQKTTASFKNQNLASTTAFQTNKISSAKTVDYRNSPCCS